MSAYVYSSRESLEQDLAVLVRLGFEDGGAPHIRAELERRDRGLSIPERLAEERAARVIRQAVTNTQLPPGHRDQGTP